MDILEAELVDVNTRIDGLEGAIARIANIQENVLINIEEILAHVAPPAAAPIQTTLSESKKTLSSLKISNPKIFDPVPEPEVSSKVVSSKLPYGLSTSSVSLIVIAIIGVVVRAAK
jgi:hypothetical protein